MFEKYKNILIVILMILNCKAQVMVDPFAEWDFVVSIEGIQEPEPRVTIMKSKMKIDENKQFVTELRKRFAKNNAKKTLIYAYKIKNDKVYDRSYEIDIKQEKNFSSLFQPLLLAPDHNEKFEKRQNK